MAPQRPLIRTTALLAALTAMALAGCTAPATPSDVAVASYPASFLAETLAGDDLTVLDISGDAALHDFEPRLRDLRDLRHTGLLALWSEDLESWAHQAEQSLGGSAPPMLELIALPAGERLLKMDNDHDEDDHHGHDHGDRTHDPHTWTDPLAMAASAHLLADRLAADHPEHAANITARADALVERLHGLHDAFVEGLQDCAHNTVITNHEAHNYLAHRYGFHLMTLHGLAPGSEPSPATLQEVIETIKDHDLPIIFIEEGSSPDALRSIQDETGVDVHVLETMETRPTDGDYLDAQYRNLQELRAAMGCV